MTITRRCVTLKQRSVNLTQGHNLLIDLRNFRDAGSKLLPEARRVDRPSYGVGQIRRVAGAKMQTVDAMGHFLGHAADVAADHWTSVKKRLLDHHGRAC